MRRRVLKIGIGFLLGLIFSVSAVADSNTVDVTIVYSNNIQGNVKPCPT